MAEPLQMKLLYRLVPCCIVVHTQVGSYIAFSYLFEADVRERFLTAKRNCFHMLACK